MRIKFLIACFLAFCLNIASASDLSEFKKILITDQGRIKPLDTFSKTALLKISGQTKDHNTWLYDTLFKPQKANAKAIFLIENPELKEALSLDTKKKRFSFNEIETASEKLFELSRQIAEKIAKENLKDEDLSILDRQTLILRENFYAYINISNSFLFAINNPAFSVSPGVQKTLELESSENSLYDILLKSDLLSSAIEKINTEQSSVGSTEKELLELSFNVFRWIENFKNFDDLFISDTKLTIIPEEKNTWISPWQAIIKASKNSKAYLWRLKQIQATHDQTKAFQKNIKSYNKKVIKDLKLKSYLVEAEIFYNSLNPFKYATIFYALALIIIGIIVTAKTPSMKKLALLATATGFGLNTIGLALRIIIMQRPPVSNLYETFIFIAWSIALIGLIIYLVEKNLTAISLAAVCGFILLLISFKFAAEGDTMQALIAVLNSNFWLGTHVITITLGYAGVFAAGIVGHIYIFQKLFKATDEQLKSTKSYILGILGFGLAMAFLGTLLGGIWADQSWGRFWGWDPKENGALLIVLWSALIFHARLSGFIKDIGLAQASIFGCIVVMLSWLGVNLLGVGLHSYGFTSGLFYALLSYSVIELIFIASTSLYLRKTTH